MKKERILFVRLFVCLLLLFENCSSPCLTISSRTTSQEMLNLNPGLGLDVRSGSDFTLNRWGGVLPLRI